jgi:uncharacterized protein YdhG (YjbR/CyaY superfamily)
MPPSGAKKKQPDGEAGARAVDAYIAEQPAAVQPVLRAVRAAIREEAPDAIERIAWGMPTFWQGSNLVHFAAQAKHLGIYPGGEVISVFAEELQDYKTSKGAIQFPYATPIDLELIKRIVGWRVRQAEARAA